MSFALARPRRILMTADTVGGVWTYALELARGLQHQGVEIALATMGLPMTRDQRREADRLPHVQLYESSYKLEWMEAPWRDVATAGAWLLELEQQVRPDLVHLNGFAHGALPWHAPKVVVGHSCVLSWWQAVHGQPAPPEWNQYAQTVRAGLGGADLVITPSRAMLRALEDHYGPLARSAVIPNGRTQPGSSSTSAKEPFVFAAGRLWDAAKNIAALEAIAPSLPWPVWLAGDAGPQTGVPTEAGEARRLGRLASADIWTWLARASIYALPARYEPFGLSALEAALAGCALVLGDIPSLREVWGNAALFVPTESPEKLRNALMELITDRSLLAEFAGKAGRNASRFTTERMAAEYWRAYQWCLDPSSSLEAEAIPGQEIPMNAALTKARQRRAPKASLQPALASNHWSVA